nr:lysozyme c-1-like [Nomia melanderi]
MRLATKLLLVVSAVAALSWCGHVDARILTDCEAMHEMQRAGISRTFISNWICLMQSESGMNTQLVTGPKRASSYSYGIFQIPSGKWCTRGRVGGLCNKRCEDFADDDIRDDIVCAKMIMEAEGFKTWNGWVKKCKNKLPNNLPNISKCRRR